jgi:hypothetical protein
VKCYSLYAYFITSISRRSVHLEITKLSFSGSVGWGKQSGYKGDNKALPQMSHPNRASRWVFYVSFLCFQDSVKPGLSPEGQKLKNKEKGNIKAVI